jgi:fatty acid desaturase
MNEGQFDVNTTDPLPNDMAVQVRREDIQQLESPVSGPIIFWVSCILLTASLVIKHPTSMLLSVFIIPVIFGTHEAIHDTLIPKSGLLSNGRRFHNFLALLIGCGIQGMNFTLIRPAHLAHHKYGRLDFSYFPEVIEGPRTLKNYVHYYAYLLGVAALAWQITGLAMLFVPAKLLAIHHLIDFKREKNKMLFFAIQFFVGGIWVLAYYLVGWPKLLTYEIIVCLTWSILQNVGHYGIQGIDKRTDWACAHTFILRPMMRMFTFGSASHLAHHVDPTIPGAYLHTDIVLNAVQKRLGVSIEIRHGNMEYLRGILRQFQGPKVQEELETSWIKS